MAATLRLSALLAASATLGGGEAPVAKRVQWFVSDRTTDLQAMKKFLLEDNREVAQGSTFAAGG